MKEILDQARQWIAQEAVWDKQLFVSARPHPAPAHAPAMSATTPASITAPASVKTPSAASSSDRVAALQALHEEYKDCVRCPLGPTRIKFVFGVGNPESNVMFIGEGPGYQEDRQGEPFIGKAGQLLDKMMAAINLSRKTNAYIANIVKCHPMQNPQTPDARGNDRPPTPDEVETCSPILLKQIAVIRPRFIVTLGSPSTKMILRTKDAITGLRGKLFPFPVEDFYSAIDSQVPIDAATREALRQIQVLPMFHPAALLRNPNLKAETWTDLKLLRDQLAAL